MDGLRELMSYQTWATFKIVDHCSGIDPALLDRTIPGTAGSIFENLRHMIDQERWGLAVMGADLNAPELGTLGGIRVAFSDHGRAWESILDRFDEIDALELKPTGFPASIPHFAAMYLLQTAHHLELHRTHIRATLDMLGAALPGVDPTDVWAYWEARHGAVLPSPQT